GLDYPAVKGRVRPRCNKTDYSICDAFAELNKLDGFDLQPRVVVPFTGAIRLGSVSASDFFITSNSGKFVSGFRQLTFDPVTHTLAGISGRFLREDTRYRIHVTNGIRGKRGKRVKACGGACVVPFTTRTASGELVRIRRSMDLRLSDPHNAYLLAGFPGAAKSTSAHRDSPYGVGNGHTDGEIPPVPTRRTARPFGADRLGVIVVTPDPTMHPPPWPAAVYGPGFTRSDYDIFVSADYNAQQG